MPNPAGSVVENVSRKVDNPAELCRDAIARLEKAFDLPGNELIREVDVAQREIVRIRDCLINLLRKESSDTPQRSSLRLALDGANIALSLVVGVEYPHGELQRESVKQAHITLEEVHSGFLQNLSPCE